VIHSGLYYRPGSLKAQNCIAGRDALYRLCEEEGIAARRCGKIVVATRRAELPALDELERRGRANGLQGIRRIGPAELRELEPEVAGIAGLWVAETGLVNYAHVAAAYARTVDAGGGTVQTDARVLEVRKNGTGVVIVTERAEVHASLLVNCAGLQSDRVARLCGVEPGISIVPFRGEYFDLQRPELVRNPVYPVPDPALPFLGVHFTPSIDGRLEVGPNAVLAWKREGYRFHNVSLHDLSELLTFGGFWKMARNHWKNGAEEMVRSFSKTLLVRALQRLVPAVTSADLVRGRSGVRAQAVDATGKLLDDFHIVRGERSFHVLNAPSPAATASLNIGRTLANQVLAVMSA
jgi:L-2-hydroxyglutarate oxidase